MEHLIYYFFLAFLTPDATALLRLRFFVDFSCALCCTQLLEKEILFYWFPLEDRNLSGYRRIQEFFRNSCFAKGFPVLVPAILDRKFLFLQEFPRNFHKKRTSIISSKLCFFSFIFCATRLFTIS